MKSIHHHSVQSVQLKAHGFPVNCFIVKEKDFCTLIDCNKKSLALAVIHAIEQTGLPLKYIILTHSHWDHVGDLQKIIAHFPQATVCVSAQEIADSKVAAAKINIPIAPDILLKQGERLGSLLIQETPGHTRGSITLIDQRNGAAYVGDLLQSQGGLAVSGDIRWLFPFPALATVDKQAAITSTQKIIQDHALTSIFCGHGPAIAYDEALFQKIIQRAQANIH